MEWLLLIWELFGAVGYLLSVILSVFYLYKALGKYNELNEESYLMDLVDFIKLGWIALVMMLIALTF